MAANAAKKSKYQWRKYNENNVAYEEKLNQNEAK